MDLSPRNRYRWIEFNDRTSDYRFALVLIHPPTVRPTKSLNIFAYWHTNAIDIFCSFPPPPECCPVDGADGLCITARRGAARFVSFHLFVLVFAIVHFFPAPLGYARMAFLGHVICFACTLLLYVQCKTAHFRTMLSQSTFYEFFSLLLVVVFVSFEVFFLFSLMFDYFLCVRALRTVPASFILVIFCCCFPVFCLTHFFLRSRLAEYKFSWILLRWRRTSLNLWMWGHHLPLFSFSRCCLSVLNQMMMKKINIKLDFIINSTRTFRLSILYLDTPHQALVK